jgi:S1-C subfamily serine protease
MTSRFLKTVAVATAFSAAMIAHAQEPKCRVPANECEQSIRQMLSGRRYLGLDIVEIKPGLVVKAVRPESPASRADFQEGDRLIAVNGKSMEKATAKVFKETLAEARQTGRLWIIVLRRGAYKKVEARLEPYPQEYIDKVVSGHLAQAHGVATTAGGQK